MLKRLFVLTICMSFLGDVTAANFAAHAFKSLSRNVTAANFEGHAFKSFLGDVMTTNFEISEIKYGNLKNPTTGYALWNKVIDSFKSDEFIEAVSSENRWKGSTWETIFENFISTSLESNLFNLWWGIPKRTAAGKKSKETLDFLINKKPNIEKTIIEKLKGIMERSTDCSECWSEDWDGVS